MLNCREVVANADQLVDGSLGLRRRLAMRFHLLVCVNCRRYIRQLKRLLGAIPFMHARAGDEVVDKVMTRIRAGSNRER